MRIPTRVGRGERPILLLVTLVFVAIVVSACASGASMGAQAPVGRNGGGDGAAAGASAGPAGPAGPGSSLAGGQGKGGNPASDIGTTDEARIVRTGSMQLQVTDVALALTTARDAVRGTGGYIGASRQERDKDQILATITYRIPVERWEETLDAIRRLGKVIGESTDAAEVTGQIVDLDARIRNLKASETALVGYAAQAPKVSDLLEIENRLTTTRGQIEQLTAQKSNLENRAALASLAVTFGVEIVAVTQAAERWDPGTEVDRASATLVGIVQAIASVAIVFAIVWLPILVVLLILFFVGRIVARRLGLSRPGPAIFPPPAGPPASPMES